jgi:hypothetical protein
MFAGPGGFDRGTEREEVGLVGDAGQGLDDFAMLEAWASSSAPMVMELVCRVVAREMASIKAAIWLRVSEMSCWSCSVFCAETSATCWAVLSIPLNSRTDFWLASAAAEASSAPVAICSMARRSSSEAGMASETPPASSFVAEAMPSAPAAGGHRCGRGAEAQRPQTWRASWRRSAGRGPLHRQCRSSSPGPWQ